MIYIHNKWFFAWMEVQLRDSTKKEANLSIFGGDAAILNVIQDELLCGELNLESVYLAPV